MRYEHRVVPVDDGDTRSYDFQCADGFTSTGWSQKKLAVARGEQHLAEHESGEPMSELVDFRAEHGLNGEPVTVVRFADQEG